MVVASGMPSVFWSSWSKQRTADYLAAEIEKVIAEIEQDTTARVISVVTDNARNMRSATGIIYSQTSDVVSGGCSAHVLNLLKQDFKRLQQGMWDIGLRARGLVLPVATRWYSAYACMRTPFLDRYREAARIRLLDPTITALRALEAANVFVSAVYRWFRWLRYHSAYGLLS
ncbi:uncharacterized protein PITG_19274 [Phytophthora infestans T30-4]|uniref:Uncharacterized protein n=1 Tax=Phytophthora infestans (strain T30-4) TaxID=403677 RepID=D0NZK8_PHYIT|nr:uncharacterized protein PITG_19274 [Phytophthora infestans T30-4]EEY69567.1 hypothetical protein PITG_19274 [Phytophthora infestans T30-4]|eukprot:XP_002997205.1 hypothetical protein PITG_19274 [Phytophthora infestans T30-4]